MKLLVLDLCCGLGGWSKGFVAEGWRAIGVDFVDFSAHYPGRFILADLLCWEGWRSLSPTLIVASTPCDEFSRHSMPWTRAKNPPPPSLALWNRAQFIADALKVPIIQENVRGAQKWLGRSKLNCGPFHLWGDVPALLPPFLGKKKESYGGKEKSKRAVIPETLARHIARCFQNDLKPKTKPAWIKCPEDCGEFWCNIHNQHFCDCPCPEIDEWETDPYI